MVVKVAMDTPKTSRMRISINPFRAKNSRGFTLIEVMVVLGILAALLAVGLPRMNINNGNIKTIVRQMSVVTREIRNQARLKGRTYRLVLKMDQKKSAYWIESAEGAVYAPSEETLKRLETGITEDQPPSQFKKDEKILKKDRELPQPLYFALLDTPRMDEPQTTGEAYIYFSPEGLVEQSAIQITNGKGLTWTLIINPLTGHADIIEKATLLKDVTRQ